MHCLAWSSSRIRRVTRSTLSSETCSAVTAHDANLYMRFLLGELIHGPGVLYEAYLKAVPGQLLSDCRSLYEMIVREGGNNRGSTSEKRVSMDVQDIRTSLAQSWVSFSWVPTQVQLADSLTKSSEQAQSALLDVLRLGTNPWLSKERGV